MHPFKTVSLILIATCFAPKTGSQPEPKIGRVTIVLASIDEGIPYWNKKDSLPLILQMASNGQFMDIDGHSIAANDLAECLSLIDWKVSKVLVIDVCAEEKMDCVTFFAAINRLKDAAPTGKDVVIAVRVKALKPTKKEREGSSPDKKK